MPKVSVVIPTYNRSNLLNEGLLSVLSQTYTDYEIIVVDDGSSDNTSKMVAEFGHIVKFISLAHSGLPSITRNAGILESKGTYIAFLDSDDQWLPEKLSQQIKIMENYPNIGLVCSNARVINTNGELEKNLYLQKGQGKSGNVISELVESNFIITSTTVVRKEALLLAGYFSEMKELCAIEDYDLWLRIAVNWDVNYLEDPLSIYRNTPMTSIRHKQDMINYWRGLIYILESLPKVGLSKTTKRAINIKKTDYQKKLIILQLIEKKYYLCLLNFAKVLFRNPLVPLKWLLLKLIPKQAKIYEPNAKI